MFFSNKSPIKSRKDDTQSFVESRRKNIMKSGFWDIVTDQKNDTKS